MKKAFSLVELLIVVTIISVLNGAALPFVSEYLEDARNAKAQNDLDEIARAITAYETVTGTDYSDTTGNQLVGRFLQKIPVDPWGVPYSFASATENGGATVYSHGPDHTAATNDDIVVNYKGKLALVSAKWFDVNGDGKISAATNSFPSTDTLTLRFNRAATSPNNFTDDTLWTLTGSDSFSDMFNSGPAATTTVAKIDNRTWVYDFAKAPVAPSFALGSDTLTVTNVSQVTDLNSVPMISAPVIILAK